MESKTKLSINDIYLVSSNDRDELGKVFKYQNKLYRAIYAHKIEFVKELLNSGLIAELTDKELLPKTTVAEIELEHFGMVLEHEVIYPVVLPPQWTFGMLQDAAVASVQINIIAQKYGYQTMDSHGYNILFHNNHPLHVDFGSFIKVPKDFRGWFGYENFLQYFYYPLKIASSGNFYLARLILLQPVPMPHYAYYYYHRAFYKLINQNKLELYFKTFYKFKLISYFSEDEITEKAPSFLKRFIIYLNQIDLLPFQKVNFNKILNKAKSIKVKNAETEWGTYHDELKDEQGLIKSTSRFDRILSLVKDLSLNSVLELGGNQGVFSRIIAERTSIPTLICTDYDETAVNIMYNVLKVSKHRVTPAVLDFVHPNDNHHGETVYERFKCDLVLALALTHHLILTQKMPIQKIFEELKKYSNQYIMVEFMPLGLYSPKSKKKYTVPQWYNIDWFRSNFSEQFDIILEEQLEKNRVLFFGKLKG